VLNANTVLQPQFMQQLLGWTATTAGLALTRRRDAAVCNAMAGYATGKWPRAIWPWRASRSCAYLPLRGQCDHAGYVLPARRGCASFR